MITDKCRRFNGPPMAYLSDNLMEEIHEASLAILEKIGCRVCHPAGRELLERNGARIENEDRVHLPPDLVDWAIEKAPDAITIFDRLGRPAMKKGETTMGERAGKKIADILASHEPIPLDAAADARPNQIIEQAQRRASNIDPS